MAGVTARPTSRLSFQIELMMSQLCSYIRGADNSGTLSKISLRHSAHFRGAKFGAIWPNYGTYFELIPENIISRVLTHEACSILVATLVTLNVDNEKDKQATDVSREFHNSKIPKMIRFR